MRRLVTVRIDDRTNQLPLAQWDAYVGAIHRFMPKGPDVKSIGLLEDKMMRRFTWTIIIDLHPGIEDWWADWRKELSTLAEVFLPGSLVVQTEPFDN